VGGKEGDEKNARKTGKHQGDKPIESRGKPSLTPVKAGKKQNKHTKKKTGKSRSVSGEGIIGI